MPVHDIDINFWMQHMQYEMCTVYTIGYLYNDDDNNCAWHDVIAFYSAI